MSQECQKLSRSVFHIEHNDVMKTPDTKRDRKHNPWFRKTSEHHVQCKVILWCQFGNNGFSFDNFGDGVHEFES